MTVPARIAKPAVEAAKMLGIYVVFEALLLGPVALFLKIPLSSMWLTYMLFFCPAIVGIPIICYARRLHDRPKQCAVWFAIACSLMSLLMLFAMDRSGLLKTIGGADLSGSIIFAAIFSTPIAAVTAYYSTYKRLTVGCSQAKPPVQP